MFERLKCILVKEFLQMLRDPRMKMVILVAPVVQVMVFGYAVTTDVKNIPIAVYDLDNSSESRGLVREFTYSRYFSAKTYISAEDAQKKALDRSEVNAVIRINRGFSRDINSGRAARFQLIVDGTDSNTASVILSYAKNIIEPYSSGIELRTRAWFNENLESRNFYLPGVIALIVTIITLLLTSMAIVREKEIGTIEQLMVSPIRPFELILGKLLPFAIIGLIDAFLVTAVGVLWFKVPIRGDLLLLFGAIALYLLTTLGTGLFISTLANTQQEALMSSFFFYFPAVLLSGFMFPIANMPRLIQIITYINPMRYFLVILRGVFLKGSGFQILWPQMAALLIIGVAVITMSSLSFKKKIG
ncbi:MAG: ABC transporter permease [Candidatus Omnitrophica bacterium]|nr:ABC transporter permease [Candidatus Omnitrophota bacterium]